MTANVKVVDWVAKVRGQFDPDIRRIIKHHVRDSQDVDDLVQEVYERLLKYDGDPDLIANPLAFIYRTTKNWLISKSRVRRLKIAEVDCELPEQLEARQASSTDLTADYALAEERIADAYAKLKPTYRAILEQTDQGRSDDEIADSLTLSPNVVRQYRQRAKACMFEACAPCQRRMNGIRQRKVNDNGN